MGILTGKGNDPTTTSKFSFEEKESLQKALDELKDVYAMFFAYREHSDQLCTIGLTISWSIKFPDGYMELVERRCPEALILLAHYCLLLNSVDEVCPFPLISSPLLTLFHHHLLHV